MLNPFLSREYIAMALIKAKYEIFNESFITTSELNQFNRVIQEEFNKQQLGIAITFDRLSADEFKIINGVITPIETESFYLDVNRLPSEICDILTDKNLILKFFLELERKKLKTLEDLQTENSKSDEKDKMKSFVLPKASGKEI